MTSLKVLENSLFWQRHVLKQSRDPVQIERVKRAIVKLESQIKEQTKWTTLTPVTPKGQFAFCVNARVHGTR